MRILLADNHVLVRQGLKGLLAGNGYPVVMEVSDGQQVLSLSQEAHFDVAILDVSMPILNGIDTARVLTRSASKTKSIFLTRHDGVQYVTEQRLAVVTTY